ncbi:MAG: rRNA adenine N-6-methyltransferase family protein [Phototrophicaceae bacterium]
MTNKPSDTQQLWQIMLESMRQSGIMNTPDVEAAFSAVPRHLFLPNLAPEDVYVDRAIPLKKDGAGLLTSSSSQPSMMAIMLNQLQLQAGDNVLEIGTASGYNAAIMQYIVGKNGTITSIEIDNELAHQAQQNLIRAHASRVNVVNADGVNGYAPRAGYDHIVATVGVWDVPSAWLMQLKPKGTLVVPIVIDGVQVSATFKAMSDGTYLSVDNRPCAFVYMLGTSAGPDFRRQVTSSPMYILAAQVNQIDMVALDMLLAHDHEFYQFDTSLTPKEYWDGYQIYLMLNASSNYVFFVYAVFDGQKAYQVDGQGIGLFTKGSAALAGYHEKGVVHCFAGADAFLEMQSVLDEWNALERPTVENLRVKLIPKNLGKPEIVRGKLFDRQEHYLHVWFEVE